MSYIICRVWQPDAKWGLPSHKGECGHCGVVVVIANCSPTHDPLGQKIVPLCDPCGVKAVETEGEKRGGVVFGMTDKQLRALRDYHERQN